MVNRTTVLDDEDTQTLDVKRKSEADVPEGEEISNQVGKEDDDLMQDEEDSDGSV